MATMMTSNKFSIHSILGDSVNPGLSHVNACSPVVPQTALTSAVAQEAALRAAFCNGYATNVMPCSTATVASNPAQNGMNLAFTQAPNQYNPAVTTTTILRPPGTSPIAWQPLAFYQDPRWMPQQNAVNAEGQGVVHASPLHASSLHAPSQQLPAYQTAASASCNGGCYGYDTTPGGAMGMAAAAAVQQRPHVYSLGQLKLKKKKTRTVFTRAQIDQLEVTFNQKRYLSSNDRLQLAMSLKMTETQVKVWFQNRRNKWKREIATNPGQRPGSADSQSAESCVEKSSTTSGANDMAEDADEWEECDGAVSSCEPFEGGFPAPGQRQKIGQHPNGLPVTSHGAAPNGVGEQIVPVACR